MTEKKSIVDEWRKVCIVQRSDEFEALGDVPGDIASTHPELYSEARTEAIETLHRLEQAFVVLSPIIAEFDEIQRHEPFRAASKYSDDKNIIYKWRCDCKRGLKYGFCGHIFCLQHMNTNFEALGLPPGYSHMRIPSAAHQEDLSKKRRPGRPPRMEPALKKARTDDDEILL